MTPTADRYRALARSGPWRWRTLHLSRSDSRGDVEAWVARPGRMRVRLPDGQVHLVVDPPRRLAVVDADGRTCDLVATPACEVPAVLDADGLVTGPATTAPVERDDPVWRDYTWVAMLDPVELSRGTTIHELAVTTRHGRPTWWARMSADEDYDPRCGCCALLSGAVTERPATGDRAHADGPHPGSWLVGLDVGTGAVVSLQALDLERDDLGFEVTIHEVDGALDDQLFATPRRSRARRRGRPGSRWVSVLDDEPEGTQDAAGTGCVDV